MPRKPWQSIRTGRSACGAGLGSLFDRMEICGGSVRTQTRAAALAGIPTANDLLARVLVYLGQSGEAENLARESIELDPLAFQARISLARVLFAEGKLDETEDAARKAAELQPTAAGNHRFQVFAAIQRGDGEAALRELN